jgi:hypothetical protein
MGLDESIEGPSKVLRGRFINLFDPELRVLSSVSLAPSSRFFLLGLAAATTGAPRVIASACKASATSTAKGSSLTVESQRYPGAGSRFAMGAPSHCYPG